MKFLNKDKAQSLDIVFIVGDSTDAGEMSRCAAFCLCFHCVPKYSLIGLQDKEDSVKFNFYLNKVPDTILIISAIIKHLTSLSRLNNLFLLFYK